MSIERLSVGIKEIDEMLSGGIPKGFLVAVVGEPGCGKTIFCLSFINQGLLSDEKGIFVTTEESRESIIRQAEQFNYSFREAVEDKRLVIIDALMSSKDDPYTLSSLDVEELVKKIINIKRKFGYDHARLVIDSLSAFWLDKPAMARRYSYFIKKVLSKWNFTILVTSQYAISTSLPGSEKVVMKYFDLIFTFPLKKLYKLYEESLDIDFNLKVLSLDFNTHKLVWSPVINVIRHSYRGEIIKINLENNRHISVSDGHSIVLVKEGSYVSKPSESILKGDYILTISLDNPHNLIPVRVNSIEKHWVDKCYVYDISTEYGNFIAANSLVVCHNSEAFGWGIEHIADGIIRFRRSVKGGRLKRYILIEKMRQTAHDLRIYEIEIVDGKGIVVVGPTLYRKEDVALPEHVIKRIKRGIERSRRELE